MTKAEEYAIKKYPVSIEDIHGHKVDVNLWQRKACVDGYQQAEKDLALTWEDIDKILDITDIIANDDSREEWLSSCSQEEYCTEILKRFLESKK